MKTKLSLFLLFWFLLTIKLGRSQSIFFYVGYKSLDINNFNLKYLIFFKDRDIDIICSKITNDLSIYCSVLAISSVNTDDVSIRFDNGEFFTEPISG